MTTPTGNCQGCGRARPSVLKRCSSVRCVCIDTLHVANVWAMHACAGRCCRPVHTCDALSLTAPAAPLCKPAIENRPQAIKVFPRVVGVIQLRETGRDGRL